MGMNTLFSITKQWLGLGRPLVPFSLKFPLVKNSLKHLKKSFSFCKVSSQEPLATTPSIISLAAAVLQTRLNTHWQISRSYFGGTMVKQRLTQLLVGLSSFSKTRLCIVQLSVYYTYTHITADTQGLKFNCQKF